MGELVLTQYPNFGGIKMILKLLSIAIGAEVTWLEVITAISLAVVFYVGLVMLLSI